MKILKYLMISVLIVVMIAGCTKNGDIANVENTDSELKITENADPVVNLYFSAHVQETFINEQKYKDEYKTWQELLKNNFDVKVNINYASTLYYNEFVSGDYLIDKINDGEIDGLIRLRGSEMASIGLLKEQGLILPLNEYVSGNQAFLNLPDAMTDPFVIEDELYAIPSGFAKYPSFRFIKSDLLEETNHQIPETLGEYYEVLSSFSKIDGVIPMVINKGSIWMYEMKDLFYANGCYPSYSGVGSINYDPLTGAVEDYMLKEGARESLNYVNVLLDEGLLKVVDDLYFEQFSANENYGTYYREIYQYPDSLKENSDIIWYLKGSNEQFLNPVLSSRIAYVLSANTSNPKEAVNGFVNTFLLNQEGYYMGYYGQEGVKYTREGDSLSSIKEERAMNVSDVYSKYLVTDRITTLTAEGKVVFENINLLSESIDTLLDNNILFSTSWYPSIGDVKNIDWLHNNMMIQFMDLRGQENVDEFIEKYKVEAKRLGAQERLDYANLMYGTKASNTYND